MKTRRIIVSLFMIFCMLISGVCQAEEAIKISIAESFNAQVNWRDSDKTVVIFSKEYIANQIDNGTNALNNRLFRKENNKQYKVNVTIDPRIELISVVQYLAGYEEGTMVNV